MAPRTELRLMALIGLAFVGTGLVAWGAWSGQLAIFGDSSPASSTPTTSLSVAPGTIAPDTVEVREDFLTAASADATKLTARWDIEAGNLSLESGKMTGLAQSVQMATVTGARVKVAMDATVFLPTGAQISYAISANGGANWEPILPGRAVTFENPAGDWRWRVLLDRGSASLNPTLDALSFTFTVLE